MTAFMPDAQTWDGARQLAPLALAHRPRAHLVDGGGLGGVRAACAEGNLPGGALADAALKNVPKVDVLDVLRLEARLREDALNGRDAELDGRNLAEHALERADGRAGLQRENEYTRQARQNESRTAPTMKTAGKFEGVCEDDWHRHAGEQQLGPGAQGETHHSDRSEAGCGYERRRGRAGEGKAHFAGASWGTKRRTPGRAPSFLLSDSRLLVGPTPII